MALPTASDNAFPSLLVTEGTAPSSPASGKQRLYIDSSSHHLSLKNSAGSTTDLQATSAPSFHGVRAYHNTTQTVAASSALLCLLNSERYDTDAYHSTVTNTSRLTVPSGLGGYYLIGYTFDAATVADTGELLAEVYLNGATIISVEKRTVAAGFTADLCGSTTYALVQTDYVELRIVSATTANTRTINSGSNYSPEFWMHLVGV